MSIVESRLTATDVFFQNPCIITNTRWKFEVLLENLSTLIEKHFADFTIAFSGGYMDRVLNIPLSVDEKDTMIGTSDLITHKAIDQVLKLWGIATDRENSSVVPDEITNIIESGGEFGTIATDVAAREVWMNKSGEREGNWRRVLNFHYSKSAKDMSPHDMRKEIEEYCDRVYGNEPRSAMRVVDATIGLTRAKFPVRTTVHKRNDIYAPPDIIVFTGKESVGVTMGVHPLSDKSLRNKFFSHHIERCKESGVSEKDAYALFEGRAGLARMEDFVVFCKQHRIDVNVQLPEVGIKDELEAIKMIAEGGSYNLFAAVLLYANTHPAPKVSDGFVVTREPKNALNLHI